MGKEIERAINVTGLNGKIEEFKQRSQEQLNNCSLYGYFIRNAVKKRSNSILYILSGLRDYHWIIICMLLYRNCTRYAIS